MKFPALALVVLFVSAPAFASSLRCTLASGTKTATATLDLDNLKDPVTSDGVYDLSITLEAKCSRDNCRADVTFDSQKLEDEAGQTSFSFRKSEKGRVHGEPVTNAPDKRAYSFYCYVN